MTKNNEIGVEPQARHRCAHCGDHFGWPELSGFFMRLRGNTLHCLVCTEPNFLVRQSSPFYYVIWLIAAFIGISIFLLCAVGFSVATFDKSNGSFWVSWLQIAAGVILGGISIRLTLKSYNWLTGSFSADISDKSILDYEL